MQINSLAGTGVTRIRNIRLGEVIPEPSSLLLLLVGVVGLLARPRLPGGR
jgi:hypothetical protein